jgi:hypothetical protein
MRNLVQEVPQPRIRLDRLADGGRGLGKCANVKSGVIALLTYLYRMRPDMSIGISIVPFDERYPRVG